MKLYTKVVPYMIMGSAAMFGYNFADAQVLKSSENQTPKKIAMQTPPMLRLNARAENTCSLYIGNMLAAQHRLENKVGKRGYVAAVRRELPGAPVGAHCMYGQYTQLMRALNETGDTVSVIPAGGKSTCVAFKNQMRSKYSKPEYAGAIKEGRAYESDAAYNAALEQYLRRNGVTRATRAEKRNAVIAEFAKHNFSLADVNPGTIMIVPRFRGSKTKFHAILFLGEGRINAGEFVPDATGKYIFAAHNSERMGDIMQSWDMSNVFCADIEQILSVEYAKELKRLESMPHDKMIEYISAGTKIPAQKLQALPHVELVRLVQAKYFGDDIQRVLNAPDVPNQILGPLQFQITRS